jgi:hypothetical protein
MKYTVYYSRLMVSSLAEAPAAVDRAGYRLIGEVEADSLEDLFRRMNAVDGSEIEMPQRLGCRSMSVGDVAVDEEGDAHYCASFGWEPVYVTDWSVP